MVFEGYDAFEENDPYCYAGSTVLKNKLGIRDGDVLEAFEVEMSTLRAAEPLPDGQFDVGHYRRVHHHLFQDVYGWAGKNRTVRTAKGGNLFCLPEYIDAELTKLFRLWDNGPAALAETTAEFIEAVAGFLGELNAIHPFREGNGRAQLAFVHLLGEAAGRPFDLSRVRRETFLPAMVVSFHHDLDPLKLELQSFLVDCG